MRRIRLDFTDIYKSGVSFDEIDGHVKIVGGRLYIIDTLDIESPSSAFKVVGSTDLNTELLDMDMVVTLPIGKNLPWIAALVGGLPTAAIVYGAGKILEKQVDSISSVVYSLDGKWDNPRMKLQKVFTKKPKKNKTIPASSSPSSSTKNNINNSKNDEPQSTVESTP